MIVFGIVLIVVGALLAYFGRPREDLIYFGGLLIFAVGCVLLLIGVLDVADVHTGAAYGPLLGFAAVPPGKPRRRAARAAAVPVSPVVRKSLLPTRKWAVAQVTAVGAWLVAAINASWDIGATLQILAVGIVVQAVASYLIPNADTPGGVPLKQ